MQAHKVPNCTGGHRPVVLRLAQQYHHGFWLPLELMKGSGMQIISLAVDNHSITAARGPAVAELSTGRHVVIMGCQREHGKRCPSDARSVRRKWHMKPVGEAC